MRGGDGAAVVRRGAATPVSGLPDLWTFDDDDKTGIMDEPLNPEDEGGSRVSPSF